VIVYLYAGIAALIVAAIPIIKLSFEESKSNRMWDNYNKERIRALVDSL
tara:strand:+ start:28619 stop:28765 length:147 start_codon:yes stop_codon:yes gene_type:complete